MAHKALVFGLSVCVARVCPCPIDKLNKRKLPKDLCRVVLAVSTLEDYHSNGELFT